MMERGIVHSVQWCDTRDMTADGHTKGSIDRELLLQVMSGQQSFKHDLKKFVPHRLSEKDSGDALGHGNMHYFLSASHTLAS